MRGLFEDPNSIRVATVSIGPPADLPGGALSVASGWKTSIQLTKCVVGSPVVVLENRVGREIVQRLFGPAFGREIRNQAPNDLFVFVNLPEIARSHCIKEESLSLTRCVLEIRPQLVSRIARPLQ